MTLCINPRCAHPENSDNAQFCQSCQSSLLLKQRYRATKVLGGGGFGKTYEATDLGAQNKVIKVLINNSPKAVELFQREAEVLSKLDNPGIPKVEPGSYAVFHPADGQAPVHCLVMERVEGMNLRDYLKQLKYPIDSETAERWLKELVLILQTVHDQGILHRDIKPQNIIFKPDGRLALIDFGAVREGTGTQVAISTAGGSTEVVSHMAAGTTVSSVGYTAPEQINGHTLRQSDFYSLGRTFVFLLTEKEPSEILYDAYNDALQWRQYAPSVHPALADLLDRMQETSVKSRPEYAVDILQTLVDFESSRSKSSQPISQPSLENQSEHEETEVQQHNLFSDSSSPDQVEQTQTEEANQLEIDSTSSDPSNQSINPKSHNSQWILETPQKTQRLGILAFLGLGSILLGSVLAFNQSVLFVNEINDDEVIPYYDADDDDEVITYDADGVIITGNRQHVCNVLLPRGPGIGGEFFSGAEKALWEGLQCENLYCDLSDSSCRTSLRSQWANPDQSSTEPSIIVDGIIQSPNQPISSQSYTLDSLSAQQVNGLNDLFNQFTQVDNSSEPVVSGSATTYGDWNALCIGEQGQTGCPKSARHEVVSYGDFESGSVFWTSRGWVLYKP